MIRRGQVIGDAREETEGAVLAAQHGRHDVLHTPQRVNELLLVTAFTRSLDSHMDMVTTKHMHTYTTPHALEADSTLVRHIIH